MTDKDSDIIAQLTDNELRAEVRVVDIDGIIEFDFSRVDRSDFADNSHPKSLN